MTRALDADVCVVGAGPAGASTALFALARDPTLGVAMLERATLPRPKPCAGAVGRRADRLLATLGVVIDVPSVWVRELSVRVRRGPLEAVAHVERPEHVGRVVRRDAFDHALAKAAEERGARLVTGAKVTRIEGGPGRWVVSYEGAARGSLVARALVGADGVGSVVRRWLGAPRGRFSAQAVEIDTEPLEGDSLGALSFDLRDAELRGYAWDFPTPSPAMIAGDPHARPHVCRGVYELAADGAPRRDVGALLERRLRAQGARVVGSARRYAERGLCLHEPLDAPGVVLVGEAAGIDPVLGEGIAQAIFYGATAGAHLAACLARGDETLGGYRDAVKSARIGLDLRARALAAPLVYGGGRRAVERALARSPALRELGARYFGGERVGRGLTARAMVDLARATLEVLARPS